MRVRDIMTTNVFTLRADKTVLVVEEIMSWAHIRHVPVVDDQFRVVGIVSHRDVLQASISALASGIAAAERRQHLTQVPVVSLMHSPVRTIGPDELVQDAASLMRRRKLGCLPVVDAEDRLIGIVSEADMLGVLEHLSSEQLSTHPISPMSSPSA